MTRKIYDVVPPKVAHKVENTIKGLAPKNTKRKRATISVKSTKIPRVELSQQMPVIRERPTKKWFFAGGIAVVILIGLFLLIRLPKAEIEISPSLSDINIEDKVIADKNATSIDFKNKIIPLKVLEDTKESSQEFPATGIASNDGKATGTITIYNKASPSKPVTLVTGTHFLSDSGKYFITLAKVTIPAMQGKTPGSISVKVQAKEVGLDYNIGSSKFSVPKLSGTAYYYSIWGESKETMFGGYTGKVKKVTKDDLDSAKDVLTKKLMQDVESSIKSKISENEIILDNSVSSKIISANSNVKADAIAESFSQSATVKISALVVNKKDLELYAKKIISENMKERKALLESSLHLTYNLDSADFSKGIEKIDLKVTAKDYYIIDTNSLLDMLKKKSSSEIENIVDAHYGDKVSLLKINFWPFWVNSAPNNVNRIEINLNFAQ